MLSFVGWMFALLLAWFFFFEGGNTRKAQRDVQNTWRNIKTYVVPNVRSVVELAVKYKLATILIVVVLVVLFFVFLWPVINPSPVAWTYGINEDADDCGNVVLVGVVGTDPESGTVYTESSLKVLGADVIFDPSTDLGREVTLWKPGTAVSCALVLPPLQPEK